MPLDVEIEDIKDILLNICIRMDEGRGVRFVLRLKGYAVKGGAYQA